MDGPTGKQTDDLLEKASLSMAFHNLIEYLSEHPYTLFIERVLKF